MMQKLQFTCNQCGKVHLLDILLIAPEGYTNPKQATMLKQFWCEKCHTALAYRIQFSRDENKQVVASIQHQIDPDSVPIPKEPETGITIRPKQKSYHR